MTDPEIFAAWARTVEQTLAYELAAAEQRGYVRAKAEQIHYRCDFDCDHCHMGGCGNPFCEDSRCEGQEL